MNKPKIFFITGTNSAGKSTIVPLLKKSLSGLFLVYDFDEVGVPKNVDAKWRQKTTNHWLDIGIKNAKKKITTVICGLTKPHEIYENIKKKNKVSVKICLLDVSANEITKRLKKRFKKPGSVKNLKKITGLTVNQCIKVNIIHAREMRKECKKFKCKIFNTSGITPCKTTARIIKWIYSIK